MEPPPAEAAYTDVKRKMVWLFAAAALAGCGGSSGGGASSGGDGGSISASQTYIDRLSPSYWPQRPISVAVDPGGTFTQTRAQLAMNALQKWVDGTAGLITFVTVGTAQNPDVLVHFVTQANPEQADVVGVTTVTQQGTQILHADIALQTTGLSTAELDKTATHEWGHALGLTGGHSDSPTDIMYPSLTATTDPSERDLLTLEYDYQHQGREQGGPIRVTRISTTISGRSQ